MRTVLPHVWNSKYGIGTNVEHDRLWWKIASTAYYDPSREVVLAVHAIDDPNKRKVVKLQEISHIGHVIPPRIQEQEPQRPGMFFMDYADEKDFLDRDHGHGDPACGDWGDHH